MQLNPKNITAAVAFFCAVGCAQGPNYARPSVPIQAGWKEPATTNTLVLPEDWWTIFNDPELNGLQDEAIAANQDLKIAVARVTEARAVARISKADRYPSVSTSDAYSYHRLSETTDNAAPSAEYDEFRHTVDFSYELDVWGRVRRGVEAANAEAAAAASDLRVVLLTLTADVARNYQVIRSLDHERTVMEETLALRSDAVRLQESRSRAGLINEVDVTRARTELANVDADLQAIVRARAQFEHALAVLCGQAPGDFAIPRRTPRDGPPEVPPGLPSELLERRPDIVEAEHLLAAASARIGVAKAAFFPTIKLTSTTGLASADLGTLVDWPSRIASVGPSITVPIFEGGRNRANLEATEARYQQALAAYRGTILNAFREVEDSLSDLGTLASQFEAVNRALSSARDTVLLANERYQQGLSSYLEVVDAQRVVLQAQRQDAQLRGQRAVSTITLAKALGGGWNGGSLDQE